MYTFGKAFAVSGALKLIQDLLIFSGPFLLQQVIIFVKSPEMPIWRGVILALLMCVTSVIQSTALHQYFLRVYRVGMGIRSALVSVIYRKSFRLSFAARQKFTVGEIVNFQAIDAGRIESNITYLHMIWSAPVRLTRNPNSTQSEKNVPNSWFFPSFIASNYHFDHYVVASPWARRARRIERDARVDSHQSQTLPRSRRHSKDDAWT